MSPSDFWELTYAEFYNICEAYKQKHTRHNNELISLAWYTAVLSRQEKLPELKSLLIDENTNESRQQTDEEMMAMCKILNAAYGGEVVEI